MTRILRLIVHNWPLKLAALGLATLLYGGLVLSESTSSLQVNIKPQIDGQPSDAFILSAIPPVNEIRYVSPSGVPAISSTFNASIDVSGVTPGSGPVSIPIVVKSIDPRISVVGFTPDRVTIQLDELKKRDVPVTVDPGTIPEGLAIGEPTVDPLTVVVSGPASVVDTVAGARAAPVIQASGLSVNQDLALVAVDRLGDPVSPVKLEPNTARVTIRVFANLGSRVVPVSPVVTGAPAAGFEVATVTVEPTVVTVKGDADRLAALESVDTAPISVAGASKTVTSTVALDPPDDVSPLDGTEVTVVVTFRPVTSTRAFETGYRLVGADTALRYTVSVDRVLITIGGSVADLDRLTGATLVVDLDVRGLKPGTTDVPVTIVLPPGLTLVSASPPNIPVTVTAPPPSPSPAASLSPASAGPSASLSG